LLGIRFQVSGFRRKNSNNLQTFKSLNRYLSLPPLVIRLSSFVPRHSSLVSRNLYGFSVKTALFIVISVLKRKTSQLPFIR